MTKFLNKFKKVDFWPNLSPFPPFSGQKHFFKNIWLCHAQLEMGF